MTGYQVTRKDLNDQQWADACRFFEVMAELKSRVNERRRQGVKLQESSV